MWHNVGSTISNHQNIKVNAESYKICWVQDLYNLSSRGVGIDLERIGLSLTGLAREGNEIEKFNGSRQSRCMQRWPIHGKEILNLQRAPQIQHLSKWAPQRKVPLDSREKNQTEKALNPVSLFS